MSKLKYIVPVIAGLIVSGIIWATNSFPVSLNNWQYGDVIEEDWGNALESTIGITNSSVITSHDYLIRQRLTIELASSTFLSWANASSTFLSWANASSTYFIQREATTTMDAWLSKRSTTNLPQGTNLYYTDAQVKAVINATTSLNINTSGRASTTNAFVVNPTNCSAGNYPLGIDASGAVESCTSIGTGSNLKFVSPTAITATTTGVGLSMQASSTFSLLDITYSTTSGTLIIPNNTNPSILSAGSIAINTTAASTSLRFYNGSAEETLYPERDRSLILASSTLAYMGYSATASSTILITNPSRRTTITKIFCETNAGQASIVITDGTNRTENIICTTAGVSDDGSIANGSFNIREDMKLEVGSDVSLGTLTITITLKYVAD